MGYQTEGPTMNMRRDISNASSATCVAAFLSMACSSLSAAQEGAVVLPGGMNLVTGGVYWDAKAPDHSVARSLYIQRVGGGEKRVLRHFAGTVEQFKAGPKGDMLAVNEVLSEEDVGPGRANVVSSGYINGKAVEVYEYFDSKLVILGVDGEVRDSISGVYKFSWDPNGERIVYVSGKPDSEVGFRSTGTWIYDSRTKKSKRIHASGYDVEWAEWDGNIYIDAPQSTAAGSGVFKFDPRSEVLSHTTHVGIYFSPDGRYYYRGGGEGDPGGQIYLSAGDRLMPLDMSIEESGRKGSARVKKWFGTDYAVASSSVLGADIDYLVEVSTGRKQRVDGEVISAPGLADRFWILRGTSVSQQSLRLK
jgi:hypothetical protein